MKKAEFSAAAALAFDHSKELAHIDDSALFGCGLPEFTPIFVTLEQVAKFIRWQCSYVYGASGHDPEELAECARIAREKFTLIQAIESDTDREWVRKLRRAAALVVVSSQVPDCEPVNALAKCLSGAPKQFCEKD